MSATSVCPSQPASSATGRARFLAACRREAADATPVWFMRQAGSALPGHRALRERYSVLELAKTPELAAALAVMPVQDLGVDAAVLYADIMLPLERMGIEVELLNTGPAIANPVRTRADVERLRLIEPAEDVPFVLDAIRIIRAELGDRAGIIGFAGGLFTLAGYIIEGGPSREFGRAKALMYREPETWDLLMGKLSEVVIRYLQAQIAAGADVAQLFDSWVGALSPMDYRRYVQPHTRRVFDAIKETGVPSIHFGTGAAHLLEDMAAAGGDLVSVDARVLLDEAWARIGHDKGIQGNLDATRLLAGWDATEEGARDVLRRAGGRPGHIFNLGHAILPDTDPALLARLVEFVHASTSGAGVEPPHGPG